MTSYQVKIKLFKLVLIRYDDDYKNTSDSYTFEVFKTRQECLNCVAKEINSYLSDNDYDEKYPQYFTIEKRKHYNYPKLKEEYINDKGLNELIDLIKPAYINRKFYFEIKEIEIVG
jgi:hypothetical protein